MRRLAIWDLFRRRAVKPLTKAAGRRLEVEALEDRFLPAGTVTGLAFVDANQNAVFDAQEATLPGVVVTLTGTADQGTPVAAAATTDSNGAFTFQNVLSGNYSLTAGPTSGFLANADDNDFTPPGVVVVPAPLGDGQTLNANVGFRGLAPEFISLRQFLTSTTTADFPTAPAGSGLTIVTPVENNAPEVKTAPAPVAVQKDAANTVIDLAGVFDDADITNTQVRFDTSAGPINVELFDRQAPRTVANFLNYVEDGRFDSSIFHRHAANFVLQGGGFTFEEDPSRLVAVTTDPAVQNEFGISNTQGTIAMAKLGNDPNSATSQFFFNLGDNSANLDNQNGGFTVFGNIVGAADQQVIDALTAIPVQNKSSTNSALNEIPLVDYAGSNFPTDTTAGNYALVQDIAIVARGDVLTYSVVSDSNTGVVVATIVDNRLTLDYVPGVTGSTVITIRATDSTGASVDTTINVTVS